MNMAIRKKRKSQARRKPAAPPPFNGDHGANTPAATAGTVIEELKNDDGSNPNRMARRRRLSAIEAMTLTMRQEQAAKAIEEAWCRLKMLESGGPLKAKVDASPKPDAVVASQVEANSRWIWVTRAIPRTQRNLVFWVCCLNQPITQYSRDTGQPRALALFKQTMDKVADSLRY